MGGAGSDRSGRDQPVGNHAADVAGSVVQVGTVHGGVTLTLPAESSPIPHQIPAAPNRFVNRVAELSAVDELLRGAGRDSTWIIVLTGLAGVGKSALARRWARDAADRYPGGQLYIDYSTRRTEAGTAVGDALAECLRGLGVHHEHIPAELAERSALFRTRTAAQPVLVLLDDVTEPAQVDALVPNGPGSAVVVTSNGLLNEADFEADARIVVLDPLDETGGTELLRRFCGSRRIDREPAAAADLVRLCGGLPIALRVAAARLTARPHLAVASLVAELADDRRRLRALSSRGERTVSSMFEHAYRSLPAEAALVYRRLALIPGPDAAVDAVALAADVDEASARTALAVLVDANLSTEEPGERYRLHDLVRLHAGERAEAEDAASVPAEVLARLIGQRLGLVAAADRAVMGARTRIADHEALLADVDDPFDGPRGAALALDWLTAERAGLLALLRAVADQGLHEQAWQLAEAMVPLYLHRRYLMDWIESSDLGAASARRAGRPAAEARLRSLVSRAYTDLGDSDRAGAELERALALAETAGNPVLLASVWEFVGRHRDVVDPPGALAAYRRSIELNEHAGERRGAALGAYFLGRALGEAGRQDDALVELRRAAEQLAALGDRRMVGRVLIALGSLHLRLGEPDKASAELREAVELFEERGAIHYEAQARRVLADLAEERGDRAGARDQLGRVLAIEIETGGPDAAALRDRLAALAD
ncbi:tetratricopeptide (TPR) repeat protein [Actinoalloteichus hoggarensis]|uniref:Regulatory protein AfsR n=1 Tax=Actinoalloteichus hoggarensis TaxID=1470176 RepID=A0A221W6M3_9PSEU|nr:AAA family ATPase [Actinoalloteichus hoggarensis]ASO21296.1 Regulatory protein AfsR [Actinoalloteichus hoggarensis]MBB5921228.1 tetratricopeptide (TPR) repeat protein [Actinoalloteichus hoggarensis]